MAGSTILLQGEEALAFLRYREDEAASARIRLMRQKQYLLSFVTQARAALEQNLTLPLTLFNALQPYLTTSLTADEVVYLAGQLLSYSFSEEDLLVIPGTTDTSGTYDAFYPDEEGLIELILQVFYTPIEG